MMNLVDIETVYYYTVAFTVHVTKSLTHDRFLHKNNAEKLPSKIRASLPFKRIFPKSEKLPS